MINKNELRLGNYIYNKYAKAYQIVDGYVFWHTMFPDDVKHEVELAGLMPIELRPEILQKCGFHLSHHGYWELSDDYFSLAFDEHGLDIAFENQSVATELDHIKYLHQLQNFYYALTENELPVNLAETILP